jgi:hypothetical protein
VGVGGAVTVAVIGGIVARPFLSVASCDAQARCAIGYGVPVDG